ncbi:MAG: hypothetical protein P8Z71_05225 [Candidatus Sulfobium sp.]
MKRTALILFLIPASLLICASNAHALYSELHSLIAYESSLVQTVPSEVHVYSGDYPECIDSARNNVCKGAYDEDADRDPRLSGGGLTTWWGLLNWGTHFWQPDAGPDGGLLTTVDNIPVNLESQNAYERAQSLYQSAVETYDADPSGAYYLLGRVAHLLADMATPAHVHLDPHISDTDRTGDDSFEEYTAWQYILGIPPEQQTANFEVVFPHNTLVPVQYEDLSDGGYPEEPLLYRLFYSMAEMSSNYDSDDADGKIDRGMRRGMSVKMTHDNLEAVYAIGEDFSVRRISEGYRLSPERSKFILLNSTVKNIETELPSFYAVGLVFADGLELHLLSEFYKTDIGDEDLSPFADTLLAAAVEHTAALYRMFWTETHPSLGERLPDIVLNRGNHILAVARPAPLDVPLDIIPKDWEGVKVEVYAWMELNSDGSRAMAYYDGTWQPFDNLDGMRPLASSYGLPAINGGIWRILDSTSSITDMRLRLNVCMDRQNDGRLTPSESVCDGIIVSLK